MPTVSTVGPEWSAAGTLEPSHALVDLLVVSCVVLVHQSVGKAMRFLSR